jgi:hypothetical protein
MSQGFAFVGGDVCRTLFKTAMFLFCDRYPVKVGLRVKGALSWRDKERHLRKSLKCRGLPFDRRMLQNLA